MPERSAEEKTASGDKDSEPKNSTSQLTMVATAQDEPAEVQVGVSQPPFRVSSVVLSAIGVIAVLLLLYFAYRLLPVLMLVFVAILFATAIEPLVGWLRRGPFTRTTGTLVVYTLIFLLIGLIGFLTVPIFIGQISDLGTSLPKTLQTLKEDTSGFQNTFVRQQAVSWIDAGLALVRQFQGSPSTTSPEQATQTTLSLAEAFFAVITFFVVAFYWISERPLIKRGVTSWFTVRRANRIRRVWDEVEVKVGGWVRGQLTLMVIIGLTSLVGYFLIGVKYWPAMALFIGVCEAIPLVGPYIGTAPAVLIAITQSGNDGLPALIGTSDMGGLTRALFVVLFAIVLQMVEGNVLVPRVMRNSVGISPLTVIISLLVGAALGGLLGALLAVPIAGALQVIMSDIRAIREEEIMPGDKPGAKVDEVIEDAAKPPGDSVEVTVANTGTAAPAAQ